MEFLEKSDYEYHIEDLCYPCIYFLLNKGDVCYVGQSSRGVVRALQHIEDKEYDEIRVIKVSADNLDEIEASFILKYRPLYNHSLPFYISIKSLKQRIKNAYNISIRINKIRKFLKEHIGEYYYFMSGTYIHPKDVSKCVKYFVEGQL